MTFAEIFTLLGVYGLDVFALSVLSAAITFVLSLALKDKNPLFLKALPFILGIALSAGYFILIKCLNVPVYGFTLSGKGVSVGALATFILFLIKKIFKGGKVNEESLVAELIGEFVKDELVESCAKEIAKLKNRSAEEIAKILLPAKKEGFEDGEINSLSEIVAASLAGINVGT